MGPRGAQALAEALVLNSTVASLALPRVRRWHLRSLAGGWFDPGVEFGLIIGWPAEGHTVGHATLHCLDPGPVSSFVLVSMDAQAVTQQYTGIPGSSSNHDVESGLIFFTSNQWGKFTRFFRCLCPVEDFISRAWSRAPGINVF